MIVPTPVTLTILTTVLCCLCAVYCGYAQAKKEDDPTMDNEPILQFFAYDHLKPPLLAVSRRFHDQAHDIVNTLPQNEQRTIALHRLLEAKDAAVRSMLYKV